MDGVIRKFKCIGHLYRVVNEVEKEAIRWTTCESRWDGLGERLEESKTDSIGTNQLRHYAL